MTAPESKDNSYADKCFVIIGAGASGSAAAETLRKEGFDGRLVMVTKEDCLPYDRTKLSKVYLRKNLIPPPTLRKEGFYSDNKIEVITGCEVINLDIRDRSIKCRDMEAIEYDKLLLATGGIARGLKIPGAELENVFTLRNLEDAERIKTAACDCTDAIVVGASFIAMETAATLTERGLSVTVIAPESVPFELSLGVEIGQMLKDLHEENGVSFRLEHLVDSFEGNEKVERIVLKDGEKINTGLVLVGIGVQPATDFITGIELNPDGGIPVDRHFKAAEDVYAAGDVASFVDWRSGQSIRIEHWRIAGEQGRIAARNMMGKNEEYRGVPMFWTEQFGVNLMYVGYTKGWDEIIFHGEPSSRNFAAYYVKDGKILAVAGCGKKMQTSAVAKLISLDKMPPPDEMRNGPVDFNSIIKQS
ncbi:NAD(FAD)-dependent dehydrogenase [Candidatus Poribacteria bacterium]|nr:NAD(FAD)-dependent dehydrogenase [Candidatus Poribacteria bacterium]